VGRAFGLANFFAMVDFIQAEQAAGAEAYKRTAYGSRHHETVGSRHRSYSEKVPRTMRMSPREPRVFNQYGCGRSRRTRRRRSGALSRRSCPSDTVHVHLQCSQCDLRKASADIAAQALEVSRAKCYRSPGIRWTCAKGSFESIPAPQRAARGDSFRSPPRSRRC